LGEHPGGGDPNFNVRMGSNFALKTDLDRQGERKDEKGNWTLKDVVERKRQVFCSGKKVESLFRGEKKKKEANQGGLVRGKKILKE